MAIRVKRKAGNRIRRLSTIFDQPSTKDSPGNERQSGQRKTVRAPKDNQGNERQSGQRKTVRATKDSQCNKRQSGQRKTVRATKDSQGNERQSGQRPKSSSSIFRIRFSSHRCLQIYNAFILIKSSVSIKNINLYFT